MVALLVVAACNGGPEDGTRPDDDEIARRIALVNATIGSNPTERALEVPCVTDFAMRVPPAKWEVLSMEDKVAVSVAVCAESEWREIHSMLVDELGYSATEVGDLVDRALAAVQP